MRTAHIAECLTAENLKGKMKGAETKEQFQRWQVIYLLKTTELRADTVADFVGVSAGTIYHWTSSYNRRGPQEYVLKGRGGRRHSYLSLEQEADFLKDISGDAELGLVVTAASVQQHVEEKFGLEVSDDYVYDLFRRHGWRKVAPRPRHPKKNIENQEAFKKNSPRSWMPSPRVAKKTIPDR